MSLVSVHSPSLVGSDSGMRPSRAAQPDSKPWRRWSTGPGGGELWEAEGLESGQRGTEGLLESIGNHRVPPNSPCRRGAPVGRVLGVSQPGLPEEPWHTQALLLPDPPPRTLSLEVRGREQGHNHVKPHPPEAQPRRAPALSPAFPLHLAFLGCQPGRAAQRQSMYVIYACTHPTPPASYHQAAGIRKGANSS